MKPSCQYPVPFSAKAGQFPKQQWNGKSALLRFRVTFVNFRGGGNNSKRTLVGAAQYYIRRLSISMNGSSAAVEHQTEENNLDFSVGPN
jgi:hypothetical protein